MAHNGYLIKSMVHIEWQTKGWKVIPSSEQNRSRRQLDSMTQVTLSFDSLQIGGLIASLEQMQLRGQERLVKGLSDLVHQLREAEEGKDGTPEQKIAGKQASAEDALLDACEELANAEAKLARAPSNDYAVEAVATATAKVNSLRRKLAGIEKHGNNYSRY